MRGRIELVTLALTALAWPAAQDHPAPGVGAKAPAIECADGDGRPIHWEDFERDALVLVFHSASATRSGRALRDLASTFGRDESLAPRVAVLLIIENETEGAEAAAALRRVGVQVRLAVDTARASFATYHVVAYPTAFCLDGERRIVAVARGYGPLFTYDVARACRYTAGLIDEATWRSAGASTPERDEADLKRARTRGLARSLVRTGRLEQAVRVLEQSTADNSDPNSLALLARLLLALDRDQEARALVQEFERAHPQSLDLRPLRARLALRAGDLEAAEAEISSLPGDDSETAFVRGMLLEARGEWKEAARVYRQALGTLLLRAD